ncbi:hypothetical protein QC764_403660 [Podospora pseudoanserina]|uniref:Uncharacterized protein n=1 Tax=Podospora pseudoanserina TaxID=2609844 RepID=A0ABR0IAG2_9PEZI|nr:hypothetical protein QC764_403660 [Podospora pseudoanserina]
MAYYACVNRYSVRVDNGTARTVTLSSHDVVGPSDHGVRAINCTIPRLVSGGAQKTQCQQDGRNPNQGVLTLKGSLPTAQGSNFTADVRSSTLLSPAITHDSASIWAWDGGAVKILVGNVATPTLADAIYGYRTDDFGTVENRLQTWDTEIQRQRLQNVATNLAVSITNGLRSIRSDINSTDGADNAFPVVGTVPEVQTFVQVRWVWLTLIVLQLGLALIFFIMTVIATRHLGAQVRKSSVLETSYALHPNGGLGNEGTKTQMVRQHGNMVL